MKRSLLLTLLLALAITFLGTSAGIAGKHGHGHGHKCYKMKSGGYGLKSFLELKLTEKQQTDMSSILDKYHEQKSGVKERLWEAKENLTKAIYADTYDEKSIREATKKVSAIKEEMSVLRAKMYGELKKILTPEQIEKFREMKSHGHHR